MPYSSLSLYPPEPTQATNALQVQAGDQAQQTSPFDHKHVLANYHLSDANLVERAISSALEAKKSWSKSSLHDRAAIFYRAASLLQHEYRNEMMAATMLGQGKNPYQADIDCVAEVRPHIHVLKKANTSCTFGSYMLIKHSP
jgi:1-pyrroline-5-carboxylate dehydrogenase